MNVLISESAAKRIAKILSTEADKKALRISVEGGGCSGFSYKYELVDNFTSEDYIIEKDGACVVIDAISLPFLKDAEIDFVDDLMGQSFQIHNPNAISSCGCGTSFSI